MSLNPSPASGDDSHGSTYHSAQVSDSRAPSSLYSPYRSSPQYTIRQSGDVSTYELQISKRETWIRETEGREEPLNKDYKVREPGYKFFRHGVVFKVLWSEPAGAHDSTNSSFSSATNLETNYFGKYGEVIYTETRWFVVIREGNNCCTCL